MSIRIMSLVWDISLGDSDKIVLLALADNANDEGACWPSIATLARKCSKDERTVQRVIARLIEAKHISRVERSGTSNMWRVHPRHNATPVTVPPRHRATLPPVTVPPKPSVTVIPKKAKASLGKRDNPKAAVFPMIEGCDPQVWADFLTNRKRKRLPNTASAHKKLRDDLARLADDEWPPSRLIQYAAAKGWGGIYDPRSSEHQNGRNGQSNFAQGSGIRGTRPDPAYDMWAGACADIAAESAQHDPQDYRGDWLSLPPGGAS